MKSVTSSHVRLARLTVVALTLVLTGCPSSCDGGGETPLDGGDVVDECQPLEIGDIVLDVQQDVQTIYSAPVTTPIGAGAPDWLVFHFVNYGSRIGPDATGTFDLSEEPNDNRGTCPECLSVFVDQLTPSTAPDVVFFQREGSLTLNVNPRTLILEGQVEGLVLEEVTIDGATLESTPVEGGGCFTIADFDLNYRYVPDEWTCDASLYQSGGECNCACGAPDPDCYCDPFMNPDCPPTIEDDCPDGTVCTYDGCLDVCDPFSEPGVQCGDGLLCTFTPEGPACTDGEGRVNPAQLGESCTGLGNLIEYCAVDGTLPGGVCDDLTDVCRPICGPDGCGVGQSCYTIAGGGPGDGWGFCVEDDTGEGWQCDPDSYVDTMVCDCGCGAPDPDCENEALPILGCAEGESCVQGICE